MLAASMVVQTDILWADEKAVPWAMWWGCLWAGMKESTRVGAMADQKAFERAAGLVVLMVLGMADSSAA